MNCNAVIINETCRINLSMKFFISFGIIQFKAIGFHLSHRLIIFTNYIIAYEYMKQNSPASIAYANSPDVPYISSAKARGFTAHLVIVIINFNIINIILSFHL